MAQIKEASVNDIVALRGNIAKLEERDTGLASELDVLDEQDLLDRARRAAEKDVASREEISARIKQRRLKREGMADNQALIRLEISEARIALLAAEKQLPIRLRRDLAELKATEAALLTDGAVEALTALVGFVTLRESFVLTDRIRNLKVGAKPMEPERWREQFGFRVSGLCRLVVEMLENSGIQASLRVDQATFESLIRDGEKKWGALGSRSETRRTIRRRIAEIEGELRSLRGE